jgi:hypothetical protein
MAMVLSAPSAPPAPAAAAAAAAALNDADDDVAAFTNLCDDSDLGQ